MRHDHHMHQPRADRTRWSTPCRSSGEGAWPDRAGRGFVGRDPRPAALRDAGRFAAVLGAVDEGEDRFPSRHIESLPPMDSGAAGRSVSACPRRARSLGSRVGRRRTRPEAKSYGRRRADALASRRGPCRRRRPSAGYPTVLCTSGGGRAHLRAGFWRGADGDAALCRGAATPSAHGAGRRHHRHHRSGLEPHDPAQRDVVGGAPTRRARRARPAGGAGGGARGVGIAGPRRRARRGGLARRLGRPAPGRDHQDGLRESRRRAGPVGRRRPRRGACKIRG